MGTTKKMLNMQVQGKRRRGRPEKIWLDNIREDTQMAENQTVCRIKTRPIATSWSIGENIHVC